MDENNFDTNINNYTIEDLLDILNLSEDYNEEEVKEVTNKIIDKFTEENKASEVRFFLEAQDMLIENIDVKIDKENNIKNPDNFLNVDNGLLLPLESSDVVQSNNNSEYIDGHQVQTHIDKPPIRVKLQEYKRDNFNPLVKNSVKVILNINSLFRNLIKGTPQLNSSNVLSTKFTYKMPTEIKRVASLKLKSLELPSTIYNISSNLGSNNFKVSKYPMGYDPITIQIPSGQYTKISLIEAIQEDLSSNTTNINIELIEHNNKIRFYDASGENFNLEFDYNNELANENYCSNIINEVPKYVYPLQLTLGWILGFRKELYGENEFIEGTSYNEYTGEASCNIDDENYYFLGIKDYLNNNNQIMYSTFLENANIAGDIVARVVYNNGMITNIITEEREYFGPVRIQNLQIILYDKFGRILDLNNSDFSMSLELTNIYNL
jgi:hypothetical protein